MYCQVYTQKVERARPELDLGYNLLGRDSFVAVDPLPALMSYYETEVF
jgi:hypothetical protein